MIQAFDPRTGEPVGEPVAETSGTEVDAIVSAAAAAAPAWAAFARRTEALVGLGVALVPERRRLFGGMTVLDNLRTGAYGRDRATVEAVMNEVLDLFPSLRRHARSLAFSLSGGEQQMLAIGRILRTGARLLLLDEPTEGLAPVIVQQIGATIREIKARGFTVLLVEQNFRFAQTVADRHYVMEHGRVVDMVPNAELSASLDRLHEYLGV